MAALTSPIRLSTRGDTKHAWPPALPVRSCDGFCSGRWEKERQNRGAMEVHCATWTCSLLRWRREEKEEESKRRKKKRKGKEKRKWKERKNRSSNFLEKEYVNYIIK
jgi:hypothetical protein